MIFTQTSIEGVVIIDVEPRVDERGVFARTYCVKELAACGLDPSVSQMNVSYNRRKGTLRGMHYQREPYGETKIVRCVRGAIYDVVIDLRPVSQTFKQWFGLELTADNRRGVYVSAGIAHGFLTLADDSEVSYLMGSPYVPEAAAGVRYDDRAFAIDWPESVVVISERDRSFAEFEQ